MKTLLLIIFFIPVIGSAQFEATPQLGIYSNIGLRKQNQMVRRYRDNHGIGGGLTFKHSTAKGYLRFVYVLGLTHDTYDMIMVSPDDWIRKEELKGVNFLIRPEFRCLNRKGFSLYIGAGLAINGYYSFMRKDIETSENGVVVHGGKTQGYNNGLYYGLHASLSMDYRINKYLALNFGANIDGYLQLELSGTVYTGQNLSLGLSYCFKK
ncbi:hypothetical protein D3C71_561880 [compost metagenome]